MARSLCVALCVAAFLVLSIIHSSSSRSFVVDRKNNVFLKDGKPFRYISGSFDYFRVPRFYWKDRMAKMKAAGLNALTTYVAWNRHETNQGEYDFSGENDVIAFIKMVQEFGMLAIVRPGPFICAEWDLGGFPAWMIRNYTTVKLRSSKDKNYIATVDKWMGILLPKLKPLLYANGGPIIAVQVENEYGMYITCDHEYMTHLTETFQQHLGKDVVLFTTDPPNDRYLECGTLPQLLATLDFPSGVDPAEPFATLRKHQAGGPLVNSEYYTGWIDHWGVVHQKRDTDTIALYLDKILAMNASVNMDMFEGGTNFGFWSGANAGSDTKTFDPQPTSYDYDAPLTEAGDYRPKYFAIQEVISKYLPIPKGPIPPAPQNFAYGKVMLTKMGSFYDFVDKLSPSGPVRSNKTLTMEEVGQNYGFMLYRTKIPSSVSGPVATISIPGLHDRAIIFVDQVRQGNSLIRFAGKTSATIKVNPGATLDILVENMGRINHGPLLQDPKGILGDVTLGKVALNNWMIYPMNLDPVVGLKELSHNVHNDENTQIPSFYTGNIPPTPDGIPKDTFLHLPHWFKGVAYINGFNVGRYWPVVGPQVRLYVPANILHSGLQSSKLVLFEVDNAPCQNPQQCYVEFLDYPDIDGPHKPMY